MRSVATERMTAGQVRADEGCESSIARMAIIARRDSEMPRDAASAVNCALSAGAGRTVIVVPGDFDVPPFTRGIFHLQQNADNPLSCPHPKPTPENPRPQNQAPGQPSRRAYDPCTPPDKSECSKPQVDVCPESYARGGNCDAEIYSPTVAEEMGATGLTFSIEPDHEQDSTEWSSAQSIQKWQPKK